LTFSKYLHLRFKTWKIQLFAHSDDKTLLCSFSDQQLPTAKLFMYMIRRQNKCVTNDIDRRVLNNAAEQFGMNIFYFTVLFGNENLLVQGGKQTMLNSRKVVWELKSL